MMVFLPLDTWIRLIVWMIIGFDVYLYYGIKHSGLSDGQPAGLAKGARVVSRVGLLLVLLLIVIGLIHHHVDNADTALFYFAMIFSFLHILFYLQRLLKARPAEPVLK
jgi:APA family basic amino acid/polyamine antiporter